MTAQCAPLPGRAPMLVVPALDLLRGKPVRLIQGQYGRVLGYGESPLELALGYAKSRAPRLHLIDLDGARAGSWQNLSLIGEITRTVGVPVQAGGGARDAVQVRAALRLGVDRVVISTAAMGKRERLMALVREFGPQVAVSLDTRSDHVVTEGWAVGTGIGLMAAARRMVDAGVSRLIYTDVLRDGTMTGVRVAGWGPLLSLGVPVMVAGGVSSYQDLEQLHTAGAEAAIVGRALLDGTLSLPAAISAAGRASAAPSSA